MSAFCVIPNHVKPGREAQSEWLLRRLLESLRKYEPELEVFLIDDGSLGSIGFYMDLEAGFNVHWECQAQNLGFGRTVNTGIEITPNNHEGVVFILNSDLEILMPFSKRCEEMFEKNPNAYIWGPRLLWPDGRVQSAGFEFNSKAECTHFHRESYALMDASSVATKPVMGVTGAFMALNLKHLKDVGLFSPNYFLAYEDVELCLRSWAKGHPVIYDGTIDAIHLEGATRGSGMSATEKASIEQFHKDLSTHSIPKIKLSIAMATKGFKL